MRAVWSYWSRPFSGRSWQAPFHEWASFALSCILASRHYPDTLLVTDSDGARLFADLEVPFARVSTGLDALGGYRPLHPNRDKMRAHGVACELGDSYVHIDGDAFLWAPLPPHAECAAVFCESVFSRGGLSPWARKYFEARGASLPPSWDHGDASLAGGVLGGTDLETLAQWVREAEGWYDAPENERAWQDIFREHRWVVGMGEEPLAGAVCEARGISPVGLFPRFSWRQRGVFEHFAGAGAKVAAGPRILNALRDISPCHFDRVMQLSRKAA